MNSIGPSRNPNHPLLSAAASGAASTTAPAASDREDDTSDPTDAAASINSSDRTIEEKKFDSVSTCWCASLKIDGSTIAECVNEFVLELVPVKAVGAKAELCCWRSVIKATDINFIVFI